MASVDNNGDSKVRIIIIQNAHLLTRQCQQLLRMHMETDYKTVRYVLTTREDQVMERSLESRSVILRPRDLNSDPRMIFPVLSNWKNIENAWLADLPAEDILEGIFHRYIECEECAFYWADYDLVLKECYNEHTVLTLAFRWIEQHVKKCSACSQIAHEKKSKQPTSAKPKSNTRIKEAIPKSSKGSKKPRKK